jgi:hypothetical protein
MRPFTDVIRDIRKGRVVEAASDQLAEVVRGVLDTSKAGELTLKLTIKPQGKGDNAVIVSAKLSAKVPQASLPDALFFADIDGDLLRDDPTQSRMFADATGDRIDPKTGEVLAEGRA